MKREISNTPASIQAKLQNEAHESGRPFNEILQYYGMERFLYRLSKTPYVNELILKGGLMFYGLVIPKREVTACSDPKDNKFLEAALAGEADAIITGDDDLLVLNPFEGVDILRPAELLRIL